MAVIAVAAGCGAAVQHESSPGTPSRYGIHVDAPVGWNVRIGRGALHAANFPLPVEATGWWRSASTRLAAHDVLLLLFEGDHGPCDSPPEPPAPELAGPLSLQAADLQPTDGVHADGRGHGYARRIFSVSERDFVLYVETGARSPEPDVLVQTNDLLASLRVEPGDFYPGRVEPARFRERPGWNVGTSGPCDARADGDSLTTWASTVPYADESYAFPQTTLKRLPREGIVLWVTLSRGNRFPPLPYGDEGFPEREPPFELDDFEHRASWEGQVGGLPEYLLWGTVRGEYRIDLRIFFGRQDPTDAMRDEAQAMLDGLRLPEWRPWELESG